jgi:hypothetical protein
MTSILTNDINLHVEERARGHLLLVQDKQAWRDSIACLKE